MTAQLPPQTELVCKPVITDPRDAFNIVVDDYKKDPERYLYALTHFDQYVIYDLRRKAVSILRR